MILPSRRERMRRFTRHNTLSTIWDVITENNDWTAECRHHQEDNKHITEKVDMFFSFDI